MQRKHLSRLLIVAAGKYAKKILVYTCIIRVAIEPFLLPTILGTFFQRCKLFYLALHKWHFLHS